MFAARRWRRGVFRNFDLSQGRRCTRVYPFKRSLSIIEGEIIKKYGVIFNENLTYLYIPATSICAKFWPLSKEYKISARRKNKNAPGSFLEQEKCPWKIIPEPGSYPSSSIPSCDSNAKTVGYRWCLLLAPNQRLKSLHDMPVWDEQVDRMA